MEKYKCKICGKEHVIYYGIKAPLKEKITELIEINSERINEFNGVYLLDKKEVFQMKNAHQKLNIRK